MKPGLLASLACVALAACGTGGPTPTITPAPTQTVAAQPTTPGPATPAPATPSAAPSITAGPTPTGAPTPAGATGWTEIGQAAGGPAAREDHTWTVIDGVAYLFGGRTRDGAANDLWAFNLATNEWLELSPSGPAPEPRWGHTGTWVDGVGLVVWSGQAEGFFDDIWAYDPAVDAWRELPSLGAVPQARYGSCASLGPDGRLWISHGFTQDDGRFDDTRAYDFATGQWTDMTPPGDKPVKRCLHDCFWTSNGELVLYGGQTTGVPALGDLWSYDPGSATWTERPDQAAPARQLYALAPAGNGALVFGGSDPNGNYLSDTWAITSELNLSESVESASPSGRSGATLILTATRYLLFGGKNRDGQLSDLWELPITP